jgi:SAM-dependent methyltransferase
MTLPCSDLVTSQSSPAKEPFVPTVPPRVRGHRYITDYDGLDLELFVCTEILRLPALHYGWWEPGEPLTLDNARVAQQRYTSRLADLVPAGVHSVLDVGCGTGDLSRALASRGLQVTALSPDRNHGKFFGPVSPGVEFVRSRFEDFVGDHRYDLIVMSESQNYIDADATFDQCQRLLAPGGTLLISGMFRRCNGDAFRPVVHIELPYIRKAQQAGLRVVHRRDITGPTVPTLALLRSAMDTYLPPIAQATQQFVRTTSPWKSRLLEIALSRQLAELRRLLAYYRQRTDVGAFMQHVRYLHLMFRRSDEG